MDLLIEHIGFDLQFVELGEHQLLGLLAPRFLLPFPDYDRAQHLVFLGQALCFLWGGSI